MQGFTKVNSYVTLINNYYLVMSNSGVTTESGGRQNMFPSKLVLIDESVSYEGYPQMLGKLMEDGQ